jgi:hypothetical protein
MANELTLPVSTLPVVVQPAIEKAHYNNGIIFLNRHKSYGVFKHELFHHLGFVDEYPLIGETAEKLCNVKKAGYVAHNLYIMPGRAGENGTPAGMTAVSTCDNTDAVAYKPVEQLTLMEFMDQPLPALYRQKAQHTLVHEIATLANFQYAYALAFERLGKQKQYLHWLQRSADQGYEVAIDLVAREMAF